MKEYTIIKGVRVLNGDGSPAVGNGILAVENGDTVAEDRILYAGDAAGFASVKREEGPVAEFDLSGGTYTVLPGLINTHVHLDLDLPYLPYFVDKWGNAYRTLVMYRRAAEALRCGVTTLRGVGTTGECETALRNAINEDMISGPRIITCGSPIAPHAGHGSTDPGTINCSGPDEFIRAVRSQVALGVDQIKLLYTGGLAGKDEGLYSIQMTEAELSAAIDAAHRNGKPVTAHLSNDSAVHRSVELGLDGVEHGYTISEETAALMAEKKTWYTPTLCVSHCDDYLKKLGVPDYTLKKQETAAAEHIASCRRAAEAGVTICTGTDLLPSDEIDGAFATVREAELLVEDAGLTPLEAIKAATFNGARMCGIDDITGTLDEGKCGDFIIVEGKPDEQIRDLRNLRMVSKGCRLVWSKLPCLTKDNFNITQPGVPCSGGVFMKW